MNVSFIPPPTLPLAHRVMLGIGLVSLCLYITIIFVIIRCRRFCRTLQSPFYTLLINQAFLEILTYVALETVVRPRKYRYFSIYEKDSDGILPYICYFGMTLAESVELGNIVFAINRLTIFLPTFGSRKFWSSTTIILCFLFQCCGCLGICLACLILPSDNTITLRVVPSGVLRFEYGSENNEIEALGILFVNLFSSATTLILYTLAVFFSRTAKHEYNTVVERKLLLFSMSSSIPMFFEVARLLHQRNLDPVLQPVEFVENNDKWFYTVQCMTMGQPWIILLTNPTVRRLFYNGIVNGKWTDESLAKASLDILTYVVVIEILERSRMYRYLPLFEKHADGMLPYLCFYGISLSQIPQLGKAVLFSLNRLTLFQELGAKKYAMNKWRYIGFFTLICSIMISLFFYLHYGTGDNTITFRIVTDGMLQILISDEINERLSHSMIFLNLLAAVFTIIFYSFALKFNRYHKHVYSRQVERKIIFVSIFYISPMLFEVVRLLYQRGISPVTQPDEYMQITEFGLFTMGFMLMSQPWIMLATNETIRPLILPKVKFGKKWKSPKIVNVRMASSTCQLVPQRKLFMRY